MICGDSRDRLSRQVILMFPEEAEIVGELEQSIIKEIDIFKDYRRKGNLQGALAIQRKLFLDIPNYYRLTENKGCCPENKSFIDRHKDIIEYDLEKVGDMVIYKVRE